MASTRNRNTKIDYKLEKKLNKSIEDYNLFAFSSNGFAFNPAFPGVGINMGNMQGCVLSNNSVDIESNLRGINSTNLETNTNNDFTASLKKLDNVEFFDKRKTIMPDPLVIEKYQRPQL